MPNYNAVNILASLDAIGNYNATRGVPRAVQAGIRANNQAAQNSSETTLGINNNAAQSVNALLARLNSGSSRWAAGEAAAINSAAASAASAQSILLNRNAANFASQTANASNRAATEFGTAQARSQGEDLNLFSTLNTAYLNNAIAVPAANQAASSFNENATSDVMTAQAAMFGGGDSFANFQNQINANLSDKLSGNVSQSTRRQLARSAISGGGAQFGGGAVNDAYAGFLGLTSEQLQAQGQQQYESLYSLYRQSVPIVSGADLLPHYGLSNQYTSGQAYNTANRLAEMGGISANALLNLSGTSAQQLTGMGGLEASQMYGTNAMSADRMFAANQLSNESMFSATSAPTRDIMGLTTLSPQAGIEFEFRNAENAYQASANNQARRDFRSSNTSSSRGPGSGAGPGGGLRTGSLSSGPRFDTGPMRSTGFRSGQATVPGRYNFSQGGGYSGGTNPYGGARF